MNTLYLNLIRERAAVARRLAEIFEQQFLMYGALPEHVSHIKGIILDVAQDAEDMVGEIERLNEELRQRGLDELAERPWEWDAARRSQAKEALS
jgi:hypothetical protein